MLSVLFLVILCCFVVFMSVWDILTFHDPGKGIYSFVTTAFVFIALFFTGVNGVWYGLLALLFAIANDDLDNPLGMADKKMLVGTGMITGTQGLFSFLGFIIGLTAIYLICLAVWNYGVARKYPQFKTMPYIPTMLIALIAWIAIMV